ncbi:MAG: EAL domain-containing protein [Pseudomonadota bacterium]|nr:EAL domain-containing protein [Pseudomonadota bacterium]
MMNRSNEAARIIAREMHVNTTELNQRKKFLEFGDIDVALLENLHRRISGKKQGFDEGFYSFLQSFGKLKSLLEDPETLDRLKRAHEFYFSQLTEGNYDWEYALNRLQVGIVHSRIGLEPKWYVGAFRKYLSCMQQVIWDLSEGERKSFTSTFDALLKIVVFDIGLSIDTYIHADQQEIIRLKERAEENAVNARAAEMRYSELVQGLNAIVWETEGTNRCFTFVSKRAETLLGYPIKDWLEKPDFLESILHPDGREEALFNWARLGMPEKEPQEFRVVARNGQELWLQVTAVAATVSQNHQTLIRGLMMDITELRHTKAQILLREHAIESSINGVFIVDVAQEDYPIIYTNPAFERITGLCRMDVLGQPCFCKQSGRRRDLYLENIHQAIQAGQKGYAMTSRTEAGGEQIWIELFLSPVENRQGKTTHYVGIINDITEHKIAEEQLMYQASHDALTGLVNRSMFQDRLNQMLAHAKRDGSLVAVLFLDLDRFKQINDSLGHSAGDLVLENVAVKLKQCLRGSDTISRFGGDEFVVAIKSLLVPEDAAEVAQKILTRLSLPVVVKNQEIPLSGSIGISLYPRDGIDGTTLLKNADAAMYRAKESGRGIFRFYSSEMNAGTLQHLSMENDLRHALDREELLLNYQPQIDLKSSSVVGAEALVRWKHPTRGILSPAEFIPLAEETGLIAPLGEWVMREACRQMKAWQLKGFPLLTIAVNLSSRQFKQQDIVMLVQKILVETGLDADRLELEITESAVMRDAHEAITTLERLRNMGVKLAIDDFGTGYSSLNYLKRFPLNQLKVDQSFICGIPADIENASITTTIITLAHGLGLKVVAEGVENAAQAQFLNQNHCDTVQGYYFSRPLDAASFESYLITTSTWLRMPC